MTQTLGTGTKTIAKNTLMLYFRMLLTMGVALYTSRVVLSTLGNKDYGIYSVVGGVVALFGFFNAAMSAATLRFLSIDIGKNDWAGLKKTFNSTLIIHIGIALMLLLIGETAGLWLVNNKLNLPDGRLGVANFVYQLSILASVITITQVPFNALIIARERMNVFALISIAEVVLKLLVVYLLFISTFDKLKIYAVLTLAVVLIESTIYKVYCLKKFEESKFSVYKDKVLYKTLISYSGWSLFGNASAVARTQGINIILNILFGTLINAAYGVMAQVQNAVSGFVLNFQVAVNPQIFKLHAQGEKEEMFRIMFYTSKFSFYMILVIMCPIIYSIDFILKFWLQNPPPYSSIFIVYNLIFLSIDVISNPLIIGVSATGKIKWYQIIMGTFVCLNLPVSYFVLKLYPHPQMFLYVLLVITFLSLIMRLFFLKHLLQFPSIKYVKEVLLPILMVGAFMFLCVYLINFDVKSFVQFIISSTLIVFLSLLGIWFLGLRPIEKKYIIDAVNKNFPV
ncbi:lipopolysaccharide biosynthesis protein [Mucilaginibacter sp. HD30]